MVDVPVLIVGGGPVGLTASMLLSWSTTYGVDDGGAVLVRPDGYVAWRSSSIDADPARTLRTAVAAMLG